MLCSSAFAIAAGVVAVGAAATGAAVSMSAADRAAKAQDAASRKAAKRERTAAQKQEEAVSQLEADLAGVQAPKWDIGADIADATRITGYNIEQLERIYPGARNQRELASMAITDYMKGIVPQDVQEQTMRMIAERGGAGFNIATAGRGMGVQGPQAELARNLGLTSLQLQQTGLGMSRDWQSMAGAFIESPLAVGQARLGFEQAAADIQMAKAQTKYAGRAGLAEMGMRQAATQYGRATESIGARLAAQQAVGSGIESIGSATAGALMGVGGAYGQLGAAQAGGTTYGSLAAAQQAAPYAAGYSQIGQNNFVPKAQAVYR